jgi:hypothetical protein
MSVRERGGHLRRRARFEDMNENATRGRGSTPSTFRTGRGAVMMVPMSLT